MHKKLEKIITEVSSSLEIPKELLYDIVSHQFHTTHKAISEQKSVEVTGLCSIKVRELKKAAKLNALKAMEQACLKRQSLLTGGEQKYNTLQRKIESIREDIKLIDP